MPKWTTLDKGNYNQVYRDSLSKRVLKVAMLPEDDPNKLLDKPERCVRLWELLNETSPPAVVVENEIVNDALVPQAWTAPFIHGFELKDEEMSKTIIDIYTKTGRILVDAPCKKNLLKTLRGQIVCIDVSFALQLDKRDEYEVPGRSKRRKSITSLDAWSRLKSEFMTFFDDNEYIWPLTMNTIRALLFIQEHRPDIYDLRILKTRGKLIYKLSRGYNYPSQQEAALTALNVCFPQEVPTPIREEYTEIPSSPDGAGPASPPYCTPSTEITTSLDEPFEKLKATILYCTAQLQALRTPRRCNALPFFSGPSPIYNAEIKTLIEEIEEATTVEQINNILEHALSNQPQTSLCFGSVLQFTLESCIASINDPTFTGRLTLST